MPRGAASRETPTAYGRALARLARRDHTERELRAALSRAGHDEAETEAALARLRREGYLDDAGFARRFARSRLATHGLGRHRIRQALRQRGVAREATESAVAEAAGEVSEAAVVDALAKRWWGQHAREEPRARVRKLYAFLLRRGFSGSLVGERLRKLYPAGREAVDEITLQLEDAGGAATDTVD